MKRNKFSRFILTACLAAISAGVAFNQTAPVIDTDGDGVVDSQDACPLTPRGAVLLTKGCAAIDLAQEPGRFLSPLATELAAASKRMTAHQRLAGAAVEVDGAIPLIEIAVDEIRDGKICQGNSLLNDARRRVQTAQTYAQREIESARSELRRSRTETRYADLDEAEGKLVSMQVRLRDLEYWDRSFQDIASHFGTACRSATTGPIGRGKIVKLDDRLRRVELDNGMIIALSASFDTLKPIWRGRVVDFSGTKFQDGYGIADSGIAVDVSAGLPPGGVVVNCLKVRFAPVQPSFPNSNGPWVKHHTEGYNYGSTYWIENGMGVAVETAGCPASTPGASTWLEYSAEAKLKYIRKSDGTVADDTVAVDLTPSSAPVFLHQSVKPFTTATLTVKTRVQECSATGCKDPHYPAPLSYPLSILPRHGRCVASYDKTEVDVQDYGNQKFRGVQVISTFILASADPGKSVSFSAMGYGVTGANTSTFPNTVLVGLNHPFAVFNHDFWEPNMFYEEESIGVDHPAGLKWPKIEGLRNNQLFSFSCTLPELTRDALYLEPSLNTFYKFPFSGGTNGNPVWTMGQGNNGAFTHNGAQAYAYDFVANQNTTIKAARGGKVIFVRGDQTGNSYYNPDCTNCDPNIIVIRHQDGTEGAYFHMKTNGVFVNQNDIVTRGMAIGQVGNTGYSTDPHLHFQENNQGGITNPSCFEAGLAMSNQTAKCYVPLKGGYLESTQ